MRIYLQFFGRFLRTTHPYAMVCYTIQLACVKLIARVHSEPGSNSYSSRPFMFTLKKESLQLQVPLQLPCYDFTPITFLTLEKNPTTTQIKRRKVWSFVFWLCIHCEFLLLQGMKIFRVWRAVCTRLRYKFTVACWSTITSDSNFMWASFSPQSELRKLLEICSSLNTIASFCSFHCSTFVAQFIRAMRTWRYPHLPLAYPLAVLLEFLFGTTNTGN